MKKTPLHFATIPLAEVMGKTGLNSKRGGAGTLPGKGHPAKDTGSDLPEPTRTGKRGR